MYTTNPNDKRLGHGEDGEDDEPVPQNEVYLVLSDEERAKGFVRPYRDSYIHKGAKFDSYTRLTETAPSIYETRPYVAMFDVKDSQGNHVASRYATEDEIREFDRTGYVGGCGVETKMSRTISETYAAQPKFYSSTYCIICKRHIDVSEFVWSRDGEVVGS